MAFFTWTEEDTGVLVGFAGKKGKKLKPPKASERTSRPSLPGITARPATIEIPDPRPVLRAIAMFFIVAVAATGGFAVGALTDLGTTAEAYVLGPTTSPASAAEQRARALESELASVKAQLAATERGAADAGAAPAPATAGKLQLTTSWRTDVRTILADQSAPRGPAKARSSRSRSRDR